MIIKRLLKKRNINNYHYVSWLYKYSKPFVGRILFVMMCNISLSLLGLLLAVISKDIIDSASGGKVILYGIAFYVILTMLNQVICVAMNLVSIMLNERFSFGIRKQIYEKILYSQWLDVEKFHTGDLVTRLTSDAGVVAAGISEVIPTIIQLGTSMIVTFFTLFYFEPVMAIMAIMIGPISGVLGIWIAKKIKVLQKKVQESESAYRSFMQESLSNLLIIKSFRNEGYFVDQLVKLREERFHWVWKKSLLSIVSSTLMAFAFNLGYIIIFSYGAILLARGTITYGTITLFLTLVHCIQAPFANLTQLVSKLVGILTSAGRIMELQNIPLEETTEDPIEVNELGITINDLTFGYEKENVIEQANIQFKPSDFIAILGESGIGKTTLVRLIMSFMKPSNGDILFQLGNGQFQQANANMRNLISYVPQGNTLFSGTIRENIAMGKLDATEEEIEDALKNASGFDFVQELPNGIDTVIGEKGLGLSEGQAQRISIARALVRKTPFLILDEATSALDENTELKLLQQLQRIIPKPTCLLITHRNSVLKFCDHEMYILDKKINMRK